MRLGHRLCGSVELGDSVTHLDGYHGLSLGFSDLVTVELLECRAFVSGALCQIACVTSVGAYGGDGQ